MSWFFERVRAFNRIALKGPKRMVTDWGYDGDPLVTGNNGDVVPELPAPEPSESDKTIAELKTMKSDLRTLRTAFCELFHLPPSTPWWLLYETAKHRLAEKTASP